MNNQVHPYNTVVSDPVVTALEIIFRTVEIEFFEQKGSKILRHCPFKLTRQNVLDPLFYLYFHVYINPNRICFGFFGPLLAKNDFTPRCLKLNIFLKIRYGSQIVSPIFFNFIRTSK